MTSTECIHFIRERYKARHRGKRIRLTLAVIGTGALAGLEVAGLYLLTH